MASSANVHRIHWRSAWVLAVAQWELVWILAMQVQTSVSTITCTRTFGRAPWWPNHIKRGCTLPTIVFYISMVWLLMNQRSTSSIILKIIWTSFWTTIVRLLFKQHCAGCMCTSPKKNGQSLSLPWQDNTVRKMINKNIKVRVDTANRNQ